MTVSINTSGRGDFLDFDSNDLERVLAGDYSPFLYKMEDMIEKLNFITQNLSLRANFNGSIQTFEVAAGETIDIQHFLQVVPQYRIILRQEGNGLLTDLPNLWNNKTITLKNNGSEAVKATVLILKE